MTECKAKQDLLNICVSLSVVSCDPPLAQMDHLELRLQETNNLSAFLANVRKEFVALHNTVKTA